jgi:hypothetical protein
MRASKSTVAIALSLLAGAANAAGPLYTTDTNSPEPLRWDTSNGPIPVYTDGGDAFTFDFDGVTPFLTIERANEITQFAFDQWNNVATSTFQAEIAGTYADQGLPADITGENADQVYFVENGYGFWVNYDTDGSILEDFFGVPRTSVLGIAFPEFSDGNGEIIEATAVLNGWFVSEDDTEGNWVAGVFTHEFGHAINLSHSQVNGNMVYRSFTFAPYYPGVPGCGLEPVHRWDYPPSVPNRADPNHVETMYPFINSTAESGEAQSKVTLPDDIAAISDLYPSADYRATTGSISGTLRLKDGNTEYSGINIIARNVDDLMGDAVSAMSGDQTQGKVGPDGRYTINNLTPGEQYVVYIEQIVAGGYPTTPQALVSEAEYWNANESSDPSVDLACDATPIVAEAGVTKAADITFNGYAKGIDFRPIVQAFLVDLSKNGRRSMGQTSGGIGFVWDENFGFKVLPEDIRVGNGSMTRNGQKLLVLADENGNGIQQAAIWTDTQGPLSIGDLNGDSCGGSGSTGVSSSYGWAIDDTGNTAVGLAYIDQDGDGSCQSSFKGEIVGFKWTKKHGMEELPMPEGASATSFVRAQAISGNGEVILGNNGGSRALAWVGEDSYNLNAMFGARDAYASSFDGTRVALMTNADVLLWDPINDPLNVESIGGLAWCVDLDFIRFGTNFCELFEPEFVQQQLGPIAVLPTDMTDDGSVIIGRAGSFFTGFVGAIWFEGLGWMNFNDFLSKQGVVEAANVPFDNPISISASGREIVGGVAGASVAFHLDIDQLFVCDDGVDVQVGFPNGMVDALNAGAEFGRCAHID